MLDLVPDHRFKRLADLPAPPAVRIFVSCCFADCLMRRSAVFEQYANHQPEPPPGLLFPLHEGFRDNGSQPAVGDVILGRKALRENASAVLDETARDHSPSLYSDRLSPTKSVLLPLQAFVTAFPPSTQPFSSPLP